MPDLRLACRASAALFALATLLSAASLCAQTTKPWSPAPAGKIPGPEIQFENENFDFGTITMGVNVDHVYKFINAGTENLIVTEAKSSCGCTVPSFSKEPIAPGGKGEIAIQFNSAGRRGEQLKTVTVKSNDPTKPVVQLNLKGMVTAPDAGEIQLTPLRVDYGLITMTSFVEQEILVKNSGKQNLTIQGVIGMPPELNAFVEGSSTLAPEATAKIIVTLQPSAQTKGGYYERAITVRSDDPNKPQMRIPVIAYIKAERGGKLLTVAGEIDVGTIDAAGQELVSLPLVNSGDAPLTIFKIQVIGTATQTPVIENLVIDPGKSALVQINASTTLRKDTTFRDRILIFSSDQVINPQAPSVSLTLFGFITVDSWVAQGGNPATGNSAESGNSATPGAPGTNGNLEAQKQPNK